MRTLLSAALAFAPAALAVDVTVSWDAVPDGRVAEYEVGRGTESGKYTLFQSIAQTSLIVTGLANGDIWYFAVRACDKGHMQCSPWSEEAVGLIPYATPNNFKIIILVPSG